MEGAGRVSETRTRVVLRKEIAQHDVVVVDAAAARIVAVSGLSAVGDTHIVTPAAVCRERLCGCRAQELTREWLAVDDSAALPSIGESQQTHDRCHSGLGGPLGRAYPCELGPGLDAPPVVVEALIDDQLDTVSPQPVC